MVVYTLIYWFLKIEVENKKKKQQQREANKKLE